MLYTRDYERRCQMGASSFLFILQGITYWCIAPAIALFVDRGSLVRHLYPVLAELYHRVCPRAPNRRIGSKFPLGNLVCWLSPAEAPWKILFPGVKPLKLSTHRPCRLISDRGAKVLCRTTCFGGFLQGFEILRFHGSVWIRCIGMAMAHGYGGRWCTIWSVLMLLIALQWLLASQPQSISHAMTD